MRIGPPCLHNSHLHILPKVTAWLGCPRFWCLSWSFQATHTHTYTVTSNYHMHDEISTNTYKFNHINLIYSRWSHGLTGPEFFCREQVLYKWINKGGEEKISKLNEWIYICRQDWPDSPIITCRRYMSTRDKSIVCTCTYPPLFSIYLIYSQPIHTIHRWCIRHLLFYSTTIVCTYSSRVTKRYDHFVNTQKFH